MAAAKIPNILKHCALAIYRSGDLSGGKREKIQSAWNIARARLVQYGYLQKGSEEGPVENIKLTGKGLQREVKHSSEPDGKSKSMLFDQLYKTIEIPDQEGQEGGDAPTRDEINAGLAPSLRPVPKKPKKLK